MRRILFLTLSFCITTCLVSQLSTVRAAITTTGDVEPTDPSTWSSSDWHTSNEAFIGESADGALTVDGGSQLYGPRYDAEIGTQSGVTGKVDVNGLGSTWAALPGSSLGISVGYGGSGTLNVSGGANVSAQGVQLGVLSGATGLSPSTAQVPALVGALSVGGSGTGTMNITNGGSVSGETGTIAFGSAGDVTVDGTGSKWTTNSELCVGYSGNATLNVTHGAMVTSGYAFVAQCLGSKGVVTVDGAGSTWKNAGDVSMGGNASLSVTNGGSVSIGGAFGPGGGGLNIDGGSVSDADGGVGVPFTIQGAGSTWSSSSNLGVCSTLAVKGGAAVSSSIATIGGFQGSPPGTAGLVTVDGTGSVFTASNGLNVGSNGNGALSVTNHGTISSANTVIGDCSGSAGSVTLAGTGSTWTNNGTLYVCGSATATANGYGILAINGGGTVTSGDGFVGYGPGGYGAPIGTVTVAGVGSQWNAGNLTIGSPQGYIAGLPAPAGTLNITGGGAVNSTSATINGGYAAIVTVDGAGSTWTNSGNLYVGNNHIGRLSITGGGQVTNGNGNIGYNSGAIGVVAVDGTGTKWNNNGFLYVGDLGIGMLSVTGGGAVSASLGVLIYSQSLLSIDVGNGSVVTVHNGKGTVTNNGGVRAMAGTGAAAGTYTPISAGNWSGSGGYQGLGGTWNADHTFTVSPIQYGNSGTSVSLGLRGLINDSSTGWSIGASFAAPVTLTATAISGGTLTGLSRQLATGQSVLGGCKFTDISGYNLAVPGISIACYRSGI